MGITISNILKFYFKYKNNTLPAYLNNMFPQMNHPYSTRRNYTSIYPNRTQSTKGKQCIRHFVPDLLRTTPTCLTDKIETHSFNGFSQYLKNNFINTYKLDCQIANCYICLNQWINMLQYIKTCIRNCNDSLLL